jgi:hypothetical protein
MPSYPSEPVKRCARCGEEKRSTEFRRDRSRKDGRYPQCKACERLWRQGNAEYMADYHRRWQQANRDKTRAQDRRYRERKRQDPDYWERRRARDRLYRARKRARIFNAPRETMAEPAPAPACYRNWPEQRP